MPERLPKQDVEFAQAAVEYAQQVRTYHRRRTQRGSKSRESDIQVAQKRIKAAMKPLRSHIGKFQYGPQTTIAEANRTIIREVSEALQRERRKLWKMSTKREGNDPDQGSD